MTKKTVLKYMCYAAVVCSFQAGLVVASADGRATETTQSDINVTTSTDSTFNSKQLVTSETTSEETSTSKDASPTNSESKGSQTNDIPDSETDTNHVKATDAVGVAVQSDATEPTEKPQSEVAAKKVLPIQYHTDFDIYDDTTMERSDWSNGNPFNCRWVPENTRVKDRKLTLTLNENGKGGYNSGEWRTRQFFGFGKFEVRMKAIKNPGVVSSFFTYTGPSDNNPWDEIDIEFLGKDTTKVQFNYYTNGQGNHEYMHDLGFDASEDFHTYGFEWQENKIIWYVDGKAVYTATDNIPTTPGKIMMNAWPGIGVDDWLQPFDGKTPLVATYDWVSYKKTTAKEEDTPKIEDDVKMPNDNDDDQTSVEPEKNETVPVQTDKSEQRKNTNDIQQVATKKAINVDQAAQQTEEKSIVGKLPKTGTKDSALISLIGLVLIILSNMVLLFRKNYH